MEARILNALVFQLSVVTPVDFLGRFSTAAAECPPVTDGATAGSQSIQHDDFALYLLELALGAYDMRGYLPSVMAAAALRVSLIACGKPLKVRRGLRMHPPTAPTFSAITATSYTKATSYTTSAQLISWTAPAMPTTSGIAPHTLIHLNSQFPLPPPHLPF